MISATERLAQVQATIKKVLEGGQSWGNGRRNLQLPSLSDLLKAERALIEEVEAESYNHGSMASVGEVQRPS